MTTGPTVTVVDNDATLVGTSPAAVVRILDIGVAGVVPAAALVKGATRRLSAVARPVTRVLLFPPLVPEPLKPGPSLTRLADLGGRRRQEAQDELAVVLDRLIPAVLERLLSHVDLTRIIREHVDVEGLVATVDLQAIMNRVDVATMATDLIATLDLPEIIRESTSAVSSETVRQVRMRGISADEAIGRAAHRLRPRRRSEIPAPGGLTTDGIARVAEQVSSSTGKDPTA